MKTQLFNPFKLYSEQQLFSVGMVLTVLLILISYVTNTYFYGLFKIHYAQELSLSTALFEAVTIAFFYVIVLYALGKWLNAKTRLIDIINIALIVKIPLLLLAPLNINHWAHRQTENLLQSVSDPYNLQFTTDLSIFLAITSILAIATLVWVVILLYNGFKIATNFKGTKHTLLFIAAVICIEIAIRFVLKNWIY